jgi:hypothetical protein
VDDYRGLPGFEVLVPQGLHSLVILLLLDQQARVANPQEISVQDRYRSRGEENLTALRKAKNHWHPVYGLPNRYPTAYKRLGTGR